MEPWEDELLWDDDFSEEEEDAEEQIEKTSLEMDADGFADWADASDGAPENQTLEQALADERTLELESELEQDEHPRDYKEVLYFLSLRLYSAAKLAVLRGQSDRNIRKLRLTIHKKLQRAFYQHLQEKQEAGGSLTLREQEFFRVFGELLQTMGKDAVIRRENKTKPRKKKAVLDEAKDG